MSEINSGLAQGGAYGIIEIESTGNMEKKYFFL